MTTRSRENRFVMVSFDTSEHASDALKSAQASFMRHAAKSRDLSRIDGGTVYLDTSVYCGGTSRDSLTAFLEKQEGSLPQGCHVK